jgi:hypothetical protein
MITHAWPTGMVTFSAPLSPTRREDEQGEYELQRIIGVRSARLAVSAREDLARH